jgi:hypothetical protein
MALLALGTVAGYGSGFAHVAWMHRHHNEIRQQVMGEFARACVDATQGRQGAADTKRPWVLAP